MPESRFVSPALSRRAFLAGSLGAGLALLLPLPCAAAVPGYQQTALMMGTFVRIDVAGAEQARAEEAVAAAFARGRELERELTRFESSSPLGVLNSQGSLADVPAELALLLDRCGQIHRLTAGSFDPSILPMLLALQDSTARGVRPSRAELADLLALVDFGRVRRDGGVRLGEGMALTLDGMAKGHIAQLMSRELARLGCPDHLVNAGGDVVASGSPRPGDPWRVAIRSPFGADRMQGVVAMQDRALATSGVYEQPLKGGSGSHLVIPKTLETPDVVSASVLARDGSLADALATAFSVQSPASVLRTCRSLDGVEALLTLRDGSVVRSDNWPTA